MWSGPSSCDDVLGDAEPVLGGELLEGGLPVQAGADAEAASISGSNSRCTTCAELSKPPDEVDRADHRLDGVGEDRGLLAAAGGLLAAAELDVVAEPDRAADLGQRAGVDDGRAQLGQPALGEVGVGEVERLGDDDAEHRVAEELQALVGRQAAVLVGVGAVRQGALEQLGVQRRDRRAPRAASAVVAQRTPPVGSEDLATVGAGAVLAALGQARCGRCLAPQAGLAQVTSEGATAFHCERR